MGISNCVFCKINAGDLPADRLFEDELILCFLDVAPINPGHAVIIPKEHHTSLTTVPEPTLARIFQLAPKIVQAAVRATDADGFNLHLANGQCAGQAVPHVHLHLIPRSPTDGFSWDWRSRSQTYESDPSEIADKIIARMHKNQQQ